MKKYCACLLVILTVFVMNKTAFSSESIPQEMKRMNVSFNQQHLLRCSKTCCIDTCSHVLMLPNEIKIDWSSAMSGLFGAALGGIIALCIYRRQREDNREARKLQIKADLMSSLAELLLLTDNMQYITTVVNHGNDFVRARENFRKSLYRNMPYLDFDPTYYNCQRWDIKIIDAFTDCLFNTSLDSSEEERTTLTEHRESLMELIKEAIKGIKDSDIKIQLD